MNKSRVSKTCLSCSMVFEVKKSRDELAKYCSYQCYWSFSKGRFLRNKSHFIKGEGFSNTEAYKLTNGKLTHRAVMETYLGRVLTKEEVVHHINGNPSDNRLENLKLFPSHAEHMKHHLEIRSERRQSLLGDMPFT